MYEWDEAVQKMIDYIDIHLSEPVTLLELSKEIGYSPFYCSAKFHKITGMPLKSYLSGRRLCLAAKEIRETDRRILDVALSYGFSSQQALTRAFVCAYGCTPAAYRKAPSPIPVFLKKAVLFPEYYQKQGGLLMEKTILTTPTVRVEYIPEHQFLGIWDSRVQEYFPFWEYHNCDEVCGVIESMDYAALPVLGCQTGGWSWENRKRGYCYGMGLPAGYSGKIPDGFEAWNFPGSYYLVFSHPPFDFLKNCSEVMNRVETLAWNFDPSQMGFCWNEEKCQDYQRHMPETLGYEVLRPVAKLA